MPVSKRSRRRKLRAQEDKQLTTPNRAFVSPGKPEPFWGWTDLGLYVAGMLLLVAGLYQIVLQLGLFAAAAGAITDFPGPLAILYLVLRGRYRRSPWAALGWVRPRKPCDWALAAAGGAGLGLVVMLIENPRRFQIHFHTAAETLVFGCLCRNRGRDRLEGRCSARHSAICETALGGLLDRDCLLTRTRSFLRALASLSTLLSITLTGTAYGLARIQTQSTLTAALMHGCYNLTLFFWQGA